MMGFFSNAKIIETLSTIKADTHNHQAELKEFKDDFKTHISEEKKQTSDFEKKIDRIQNTISEAIICPFSDDINNHAEEMQELKIRDVQLENKIKECRSESKRVCIFGQISKFFFKKSFLP